MKLPEIGLGPVATKEEIYEAIVRDCAKVCLNQMYHGLCGNVPTINAANHALRDCEKAILSRYGLEPK